eukprot:g4403.t1
MMGHLRGQVVLVLVKRDGLALEWAAESLKADREVVLAAVRKGAFALEYAASSLKRDRSFILEAVQCNGYALACAPKFQGDRQIVETAVREDGSALEYASEELRRNKDLALIAVENDSALEHVAELLWSDRAFAAAAVAKNEAAVEHLPSQFLSDRAFLLDGVAANPHVLLRLENANPSVMGPELMVQALRRNCGCFGLCFKEKPKWFSKDILVGALSAKLLQELHSHAPELLDRDFLRSAVEVTPEALWYADSTLKSDTELVKALSCRRAESLQYADAELRSNQKFLLALIEQNGACLKFCSEALLQNHDFNLKALQQNSLARDHVDAKLWADTSFVLKALECLEISTRTALEKVGTKHPELLADWNFALQAVERRGSALEFLSAFYQDDRAVVSVAMEDDPQALAFASPLLREDRVLVQSALRKDGSVLSHAGPGIQDTVTLVLEATKTTPSAFQFASERVRKDQDVVWQALKISPQVLAFSPLAADGNFVLSAAIHFEAAVQFAAEACTRPGWQLPVNQLNERYASLKLPPSTISEKEQRDRLKKVSFWKALPFTALREQCWNMGMRSAYFNSADFGNDKLVREAVWHQWANGSKSPWNDDPPKPDKEKKPKECNELAVHALVNVSNSLILVIAITWGGGEKLNGSGLTLIVLEAFIYPLSLLLMAYNFSLLFTQVEFAVKVLPITNLLLGTIPTSAIYILNMTGNQTAAQVMSVVNPVYGLPGVIVMMMSSPPTSLLGHFTAPEAIPMYGSIMMCVMLASNLIYQDARSRSAVPGRCQEQLLKTFLNCTDVAQLTYDPIARPCCRAQKAWDQLVADGGCGGPDGAGPSQGNCDAALELCMDCEAAVQYYAQNATALGTRNVSVDISSTRLLVDAITVQNQIHAELDGCASPSAPPKPKPVPPAPPTPTARPQGFANAANECALRAAASVANVAAGTGTAELTLAELAASPTSPALDAAFAACGALVEEAPEPAPKAGPCRPRHYASAYALHGAFLVHNVLPLVT